MVGAEVREGEAAPHQILAGGIKTSAFVLSDIGSHWRVWSGQGCSRMAEHREGRGAWAKARNQLGSYCSVR